MSFKAVLSSKASEKSFKRDASNQRTIKKVASTLSIAHKDRIAQSRSRDPLAPKLSVGGRDLSFKQMRDAYKMQKSSYSRFRAKDKVYKHLGRFFDKDISAYDDEQLRYIHRTQIIDFVLDKEEALLERHKQVLSELERLEKASVALIDDDRVDVGVRVDKLDEILERKRCVIEELMARIAENKEILTEQKDFADKYCLEQTN